jgi:hypothetical protein
MPRIKYRITNERPNKPSHDPKRECRQSQHEYGVEPVNLRPETLYILRPDDDYASRNANNRTHHGRYQADAPPLLTQRKEAVPREL